MKRQLFVEGLTSLLVCFTSIVLAAIVQSPDVLTPLGFVLTFIMLLSGVYAFVALLFSI
jgi:hypothetical protein